jgi:hypothetical protein
MNSFNAGPGELSIDQARPGDYCSDDEVPQYESYRVEWRLPGDFKIVGRVDALSPKEAAEHARELLVLQHPQWRGIGLPTVRRQEGQ